ncbi:hypothetical protein WJX74_006518 [Apatococcus lobatus]|uniref:Uncharacterized protein n=1 Tax=Apatococcus lobatus TaxID=904363 RepID=A0AAW1S250_9CHLO
MNVLRVGQELGQRGYRFVWLISDSQPSSRTLAETRRFDNLEVIEYKAPQDEKFTQGGLSRDPMESIKTLVADQQRAARGLFNDKAALQKLKDLGVELLLKDGAFAPASLLADLLEVPSVDVVPIPVLLPWFSARYSIPQPVAYLPSLGAPFTPNMTLLQRVINLLASWAYQLLVMRPMGAALGDLAAELNMTFPESRTAAGVSPTAAIIAVTDWAFEFPFPIPPKLHMVGPVLASNAKPLPQELSFFLSSGMSNGNKAVYVSMGTLTAMFEPELRSMALGLSALPNPVLWKLPSSDLPGNLSLTDLPLGPNIRTVDWASQNDILGHPSVGAFVTQGGINSMHEAIFHAVPVVVTGLTADQPMNALKAEHFGFGISLDPARLDPVDKKPIESTIRRILTAPTFKANAIKLQKRMHWTRHPAEKAADIVEKVLLTEGEEHLQTGQHTLRWWQNSLIDVYGVLALMSVAALAMLCLAGCFIWRVMRRLGPRTVHFKQQ